MDHEITVGGGDVCRRYIFVSLEHFVRLGGGLVQLFLLGTFCEFCSNFRSQEFSFNFHGSFSLPLSPQVYRALALFFRPVLWPKEYLVEPRGVPKLNSSPELSWISRNFHIHHFSQPGTVYRSVNVAKVATLTEVTRCSSAVQCGVFAQRPTPSMALN